MSPVLQGGFRAADLLRPQSRRLELSVNTYCGVFQASKWGGAPMYQKHCGTYPNTSTLSMVLLDLR